MMRREEGGEKRGWAVIEACLNKRFVFFIIIKVTYELNL